MKKTISLVLDVIHSGDGNTVRHVITHLPATIGRAFDNDVILDDPFVDPHHAVIEKDADTDKLILRDLHSKNGIVDDHHIKRKLPLTSGHEFTLGRSEIRYYAATHPLTPTLKLEKQRSWQRKVQQPLFVWPLYFCTLLVVSGWTYLNIWSEEVGSTLATAAVATGSAILIWAAAWALVGRLIHRRAQFAGHIALACLYTLASCVIWIAQSYANFLWNENFAARAFDYLSSFVVLTALLAGSLALSTTMLKRRRRAAAAISAAGVLFGSLAFTLIAQKNFDSEPHYASGIEPYLYSFAPAITPEKLMKTNEKLFQKAVFAQKTPEKG